MDINSLLSPQDSPADTPPPPPPAPSRASPSSIRSPAKRPPLRHVPSRTPSGLSQQITSSPSTSYHHEPLPAHTHSHGLQQQQHAATPPSSFTSYTSVPNGRVHSATSTPPVHPMGSPMDARMTPPHPLGRQASTPGMDALADLASMQHSQQAARQSSHYQARPSISLQNIPRAISAASGSDITMAEPSPKPPRTFASHAMSPEETETLNQLEIALKENPFDYYSHVSFIHILHTGLQQHASSSGPDGSYPDPQSYELLSVLREAYETMDSKYALGEQIWLSRLDDEKMLASNVEERMAVLELADRATQEEPYSAKLWVAYADYISHLISCAWDSNPPEPWSPDEKEIGKEVFQLELLLESLKRGADRVKYNVSDSSLVWDRYLQALQDDLERGYTEDKMKHVSVVFDERLSQPHATWDNTFSAFSQFTSKYNEQNYEAIMQNAAQRTANVKQMYAAREENEFNLLKTLQQGDSHAEYVAMTRYLDWEKKTMGTFSFPYVNALFERATLRFSIQPDIWEDYVEFLATHGHHDRSVSMLTVLERATRHCPWSGSLWSHRILTMEAEQRSFNEIERVKHNATETGLLEHTDLEELIKVQIAWCGYLRRKAFDDPKATEDDADIAEVGIRSSLELVDTTGRKKYGEENWHGDPKYRLERIHIKFWTQRGNLEEARQIWDQLAKQQKDSYDFWYRYYIFEMVVWSYHAVRNQSNAGEELKAPSMATAVLEKGLRRLQTLDQPEPLMEMYMHHCEQHETVLKARSATIERRGLEKIIGSRRQKEYELAQTESGDAYRTDAPNEASQGPNTGKRKLDQADLEHTEAKKARQDEGPATSTEAIRQASEAPSDANSAQVKRDREHASVIVRGLPEQTTMLRVRQFFTDVGEVRNVTLKPEVDQSITATIEFATSEEADYALTKQAKGFDGHDISITKGEHTTLFVANYPPHADEAYLRRLFKPFGEIVQIRMPSLKKNTHRRFSYIQFTSSDDATSAADKLNGTEIEGFKLVVKISAPEAKTKRNSATAEGREVYVWHLPWRVKAAELKEAFTKFGDIDFVKLPTMANGNNKGFGYITFAKKEDAMTAVAEMNGADFWGLEMKVEIASEKPATKQKFTSTLENTASPKARESTPAETQPAALQERSLAILDLPDTVNDARVAKLVEPYGYKKVTLMPQHSGAIIEFTTVEAVGKAALALDGLEIVEGRKIRTGTVQELKSTKGEWKPSNNFVQPVRVNRPAARGAAGPRGRGRGKPGLGAKAGTPRTAGSSSSGGQEHVEAKSNADFRAMLLGSGSSNSNKPTSNGNEEAG